MVDLDADAHQYRLDEIEGLKADIDRLIAKCFEQHEYIERLEAALRVAAGYISTKESHTDQHLQDVYDWIISAALAGEKKDG